MEMNSVIITQENRIKVGVNPPIVSATPHVPPLVKTTLLVCCIARSALR